MEHQQLFALNLVFNLEVFSYSIYRHHYLNLYLYITITFLGETGGEVGGKRTALSSVTDALELSAASGTENSDWLIDNRKLSGRFDKY